MRYSITLAAGLARDPLLIPASMVLGLGLALVALVSAVIAWRGRLAAWLGGLSARP